MLTEADPVEKVAGAAPAEHHGGGDWAQVAEAGGGRQQRRRPAVGRWNDGAEAAAGGSGPGADPRGGELMEAIPAAARSLRWRWIPVALWWRWTRDPEGRRERRCGPVEAAALTGGGRSG